MARPGKKPARTPAKAAKKPARRTATKRKRGRQSKFTPALGAAVCEKLAGGLSLRSTMRQIAAETGVSISPDAVRRWAAADKRFASQFAHARESGYQHLADELVDICDDGANDWMDRELRNGKTIRIVDEECVKRSQLRVETRKWIVSKMLPKVYGDKQTVEHTGQGFKDMLAALTTGKFKPKAFDPREDDDV